MGQTLNSDWTYIHLQQNTTSTIEKKLVNLRGFPYSPLNLVNFGPEITENGWWVFADPYSFTLGDTTSLTTWTLYNRQQENFGTCYVVARAYSLEQQKVGLAHAGLCHASSYYYFYDDDDVMIIIIIIILKAE